MHHARGRRRRSRRAGSGTAVVVVVPELVEMPLVRRNPEMRAVEGRVCVRGGMVQAAA